MNKTSLLFSLLLLAQAQALTPANLTYGGAAFKQLTSDSYKLAGLPDTFSAWLAQAYTTANVPLAGAKTLEAGLQARQAELGAAKTPAEKDRLARDTATWAHKFIKKAVPTFSLERGFELANLERHGERQCLAQSTVIASLLQKVGLNTGLVMVWKSMSGQESNLGHVTAVLRLPSGAGDVQVDASEPEPFATHEGILIWNAGSYRFVMPLFGKAGLMTAYGRTDGQGQVRPSDITLLSLGYIRSQFDYYRAERAVGGVLATGGKVTPQGLKASEIFLRQALTEEPQNALASNVLGTVLRKEGQNAQARAQYRKAAALYSAQGHMPAGMQANLAWANAN